MPTIRKYALPDIKATAEWLLQELKDRKVVALHGEMGAGKTTLVSAVCELLKVEDVVSSPTFSIINEYNYVANGIRKPFYHIDLYRLKDEDEAIRAGAEDCLYSGNYCFVEWPERAAALFPENAAQIWLQAAGALDRALEIR